MTDGKVLARPVPMAEKALVWRAAYVDRTLCSSCSSHSTDTYLIKYGLFESVTVCAACGSYTWKDKIGTAEG